MQTEGKLNLDLPEIVVNINRFRLNPHRRMSVQDIKLPVKPFPLKSKEIPGPLWWQWHTDPPPVVPRWWEDPTDAAVCCVPYMFIWKSAINLFVPGYSYDYSTLSAAQECNRENEKGYGGVEQIHGCKALYGDLDNQSN